MNKVVAGLKAVGEGIVIALVLLALLPIIAIFMVLWLVVYGIPLAYASAWSRIRHDPKVVFDDIAFDDESWPDAMTKTAFLASYEKLSRTIARLSGAIAGPVRFYGFEVLDEPGSNEWKSLSLDQNFNVTGITAKISLQFGTVGDGDDRTVMMGNSDVQQESAFPPVDVEVTFGEPVVTRTLTLASVETAWFLIGLLRGDYRYVSATGQLWVYVKEQDAWLVEYRAGKRVFGVRRKYSEGRARRFWHDAKSDHK